jgi:deoxyribodipyrimidine photo-lyase
MPVYNNGLVIFTRDLRIQDNSALNMAADSCRNVYTAFFFTPEQVSTSNKYRSIHAIQFMIESLKQLSSDISKKGGKLITLYGKPDDCLTTLFTGIDIGSVFINKDITKYAKTRFNNLTTVCKRYKVPIVEVDDYYLTTPGSVTNSTGGIYQKFTPYYNNIVSQLKSKQIVIAQPYTKSRLHLTSKRINNIRSDTESITLDKAYERFAKGGSIKRYIKGGRTNALKQMRLIQLRASNYEATRNDLSDKTTQLSAYIKFGCVSIREVYYAFRNDLDIEASASLIRQLFWRDFYAQLMHEKPDLLFKPMRKQYSKIKWSNSSTLLKAWEKGETGFPIIDAGMRELYHTGYMHNRARLICASFLPKTLLINWQKGEEHFAKNLVDYDPASNNGNWQWVAGTGSDSQPYFRILNPFLQSKKYDPKAEYIKKWVPELRNVPAEDIHKWDTKWFDYTTSQSPKSQTQIQSPLIDYPAPIVDYNKQKETALKLYKEANE